MSDALHNQIATALAAVALTVVGGSAYNSTMRGTSPAPKSNLPPAPYTIIGPPRGQLIAGSWERLLIKYPMRVYTAKLRSLEQTQHDVNEWVDAFLAYFQTGISLGVAGVTDALIDTWNTDAYYEVNGEPYQAVDFVVAVEVDRAATYTS